MNATQFRALQKDHVVTEKSGKLHCINTATTNGRHTPEQALVEALLPAAVSPPADVGIPAQSCHVNKKLQPFRPLHQKYFECYQVKQFEQLASQVHID